MRPLEGFWNTVISFQMFEFSCQKMGKIPLINRNISSFSHAISFVFDSDSAVIEARIFDVAHQPQIQNFDPILWQPNVVFVTKTIVLWI